MKKTLALVLALVMVLGMMAIPASASDFTDKKAITYTEAVDVMAAAGVINGFENGSFDPDGYLTREQAAKVVTYMLLGAKNADALKATSAPFTDVAANRWSAGYIAYCVSEGIINGRTDKIFDPTGNVTGYEFAKLMLGCLGYSSKIEQYVGASWAVNVAKTALDIDMFEGNDGANYNAPLTREEAALYSFNTMKSDLVDYESQGTSIDLGNGIVINTGASKAKVVETNNDKGTIAEDGVVQFAEKHFTKLELVHGDASDAFARPANTWKYDKEEVGSYAKEAEAIYTAAVTGGTIYNALGKDKNPTFKFFVDGEPAGTTFQTANNALTEEDNLTKGAVSLKNGEAKFEYGAGKMSQFGKNGLVMEIYEDDEVSNGYIVCFINTYVAEINTWTAANKSKDTEEYVTLNKITGPSAVTNKKFETTDFSDDDADDATVVYYTFAGGEIQSVAAAESVSGFVSVSSSSSFTLGGTSYKYSFNKSGLAEYVKGGDDTVAYLDAYGYAIYIDKESNTSTDVAYVLGFDNEGKFDEDTYYAKLLLTTGEVIVVTTDKDYSNTDNLAAGVKVVNYTEGDDSEYSLSAASRSSAATATVKIESGKTAIALGSSSVNRANANTIFVVETLDGSKKVYTVYTGYKNVSGFNATGYGVVANKTNTNVADVVFVIGATDAGSKADKLTYVAIKSKPGSATSDSSGSYYKLNVVVEGEVTTRNFAASLFAAGGALAGSDDVMLSSMTTNSKGIVTAVTKSTDYETATGGTRRASGGLVGLGDNSYDYTSSTTAFTVTADGVITKYANGVSNIANDDNDTVIFTVDDDDENLLLAVYIKIVD